MSTVDWIKLAIIGPLFFGGGPLLGAFLRNNITAQRWVFAAMCFMTINGLFGPGNWGLTLDSVELYRGHAKGYHFYFNHILAIALITACLLENSRSFRWFPPGGVVYALFVLLCTLSIVNAPRVDYVLMAVHKMTFFYLIFLAAFNWMKGSREIGVFMTTMDATMCWQVLIVLKLKYLDGIYQARGTFEHQNPLAMYAVLIGMPMLAVAIGPQFRGRAWCVAGFLSCGIIVQSALSRAALLMFVLGTVGVLLLSFCEKPTNRRFVVTGALGVIAAIGMIFTLDTIIARFHDDGNQASKELREVLNEAARMMEADHTLGIGWNNYALCVNEPYPYAEVIYDWTRGRGMKVNKEKPNAPVESHYYLLLGENGYLGLLGWLLVIGLALLRNAWAFIVLPHSFERCVCLGIFIGCSLNYVQSSLERVLTQPRNFMLWLILYALTARLWSSRREFQKTSAAVAPAKRPPALKPAIKPGAPEVSLPDSEIGAKFPKSDFSRKPNRQTSTGSLWTAPEWASKRPTSGIEAESAPGIAS